MADLFYDASNLVFPPRDIMPRAKAAAQRAVELDPSLAAAHVSLGLIASKYEWDWDVAEREFQAALGIDPNLATAHLWYGTYPTRTAALPASRFSFSIRAASPILHGG